MNAPLAPHSLADADATNRRFAIDDGLLRAVPRIEETTKHTNCFFLHHIAHRHVCDTTVPVSA